MENFIKYIIILIVSFPNFAFSQVIEKWTALYVSPNSPSLAEFYDIAVDNIGNVIATGVIGNEAQNYLTVKYNVNGITQWAVQYNGTGNEADWASSVKVDNLGNIYVTGASYGGSRNGKDIVTIKYNSAGQFIWSARYNGTGSYDDMGVKLKLDNSGNVYVTGTSWGVNRGNIDFVTLKYNNNGALLWAARYNGIGNIDDEPKDISIDNFGNVFVTGNSYVPGISSDYVTLKYNSSGSLLWVSKYNGSANGYDEVAGLVVDISGNSYVTGYSDETGTGWDVTTIKYNPNGSQSWISRYVTAGPDISNSIAIDASGNIIVGASNNTGVQTLKYNNSGILIWNKTYYDLHNNYYGPLLAIDNNSNIYSAMRSEIAPFVNDVHTVKYNSSGVQQWRMVKDIGTRDYFQSITTDQSGNAYIAGYVMGPTTSVAFVTKYVSVYRNIAQNELPSEFSLFQNYPNPFNPVTKFYFDIPYSQNVTVEIYNSLGTLVSALFNGFLEAGKYEFNWDGTEFSSGIYFYLVRAGTYTETKKMILLK